MTRRHFADVDSMRVVDVATFDALKRRRVLRPQRTSPSSPTTPPLPIPTPRAVDCAFDWFAWRYDSQSRHRALSPPPRPLLPPPPFVDASGVVGALNAIPQHIVTVVAAAGSATSVRHTTLDTLQHDVAALAAVDERTFAATMSEAANELSASANRRLILVRTVAAQECTSARAKIACRIVLLPLVNQLRAPPNVALTSSLLSVQATHESAVAAAVIIPIMTDANTQLNVHHCAIIKAAIKSATLKTKRAILNAISSQPHSPWSEPFISVVHALVNMTISVHEANASSARERMFIALIDCIRYQFDAHCDCAGGKSSLELVRLNALLCALIDTHRVHVDRNVREFIRTRIVEASNMPNALAETLRMRMAQSDDADTAPDITLIS